MATVNNPILGWRANIDFGPVIKREAVIAYVAKYAKVKLAIHKSQGLTLEKVVVELGDKDFLTFAAIS